MSVTVCVSWPLTLSPRCAMQADPAPTRVKGASNVLVYKEVSQSRATFVIQNKSESNVSIQMDLSRSSGIITNRWAMEWQVLGVTCDHISDPAPCSLCQSPGGPAWWRPMCCLCHLTGIWRQRPNTSDEQKTSYVVRWWPLRLYFQILVIPGADNLCMNALWAKKTFNPDRIPFWCEYISFTNII